MHPQISGDYDGPEPTPGSKSQYAHSKLAGEGESPKHFSSLAEDYKTVSN